LFDRSRTGRGRKVEVSMLEAMAHFAVEPYAAYFALGTVPRSADRPRLAQAHILRTGDNGLIAIHLSSLEKFWTGLVAALDAPQLAVDPRFATRLARIENYDALGRELDQLFSRHPTAHWVEQLGTKDVPFAPINRVDAAVRDPQVQHLGLMVPVHEPHAATHAVRPAVQFDGQRADAVYPAPWLDEHGAAIRARLAGSPAWPGRD
jgi:crotonobetainyl-CoA:carnitine CoA-transferase CaiB-like acyl-CoA transferase